MHPYHQVVELDFQLPTRLYAGMLVVWLLRPNLQKKFPLHKNRRADFLGFLAWCAMIGRRECRLLTEIETWNRELQKPISLPELRSDPWAGTFTVGMYLAGLHRAKYWDAQIQANPKLRHRTARWYFREGRQTLGLMQVPGWQLKALTNNDNQFQDFKHRLALPNDSEATKAMVAANGQDLVERWESTESKGHSQSDTPQRSVKLNHPGQFERSLAAALPVLSNRLLPFVRAQAKRPVNAQVTAVAKSVNEKLQENRPEKKPTKPFGVNLFGYAKGELGIGEDVRMLALALKAANVPFCVINIELGKDISQQDSSVDSWVVSKPKYGINVFCMTGIEMCRYITESGAQFLPSYYNIGLWPWELPQWPEAWHHAWSLVDEIWGISNYTASAYASAPVPVVPMPLPVVIGEVAPLLRSRWGLPAEAYLFVVSFDMNSRITRKNPQAAIRAFRQAAEGMAIDEAGLVLKISHLKPQSPKWKEVVKLIDGDPRIHLVTTELRRPEVLSLYQNCDCYVSLHRSEGFGRGLAEAQLLGLSLIATGYSGNMEFCHPPTECVDYTLIDLAAGDYFYGDGQQWAEPDIQHAAQLMKQHLHEVRPETPVEYDTEHFSTEYCGEIFKQRLHVIVQPVEENGDS